MNTTQFDSFDDNPFENSNQEYSTFGNAEFDLSQQIFTDFSLYNQNEQLQPIESIESKQEIPIEQEKNKLEKSINEDDNFEDEENTKEISAKNYENEDEEEEEISDEDDQLIEADLNIEIGKNNVEYDKNKINTKKELKKTYEFQNFKTSIDFLIKECNYLNSYQKEYIYLFMKKYFLQFYFIFHFSTSTKSKNKRINN